MKSNHTSIAAVSLVGVSILAGCNLPTASSAGPASQDIARTMVAQTMAAVPSPTGPAAAEAPSKPVVMVTTATNCRTGPDPSYPLVSVFQPGVQAPMVGKYTPANYWVITLPNGTSCWLWGAYASTQGDVAGLPEMAAPPPPPVAAQPQATATKPPKSGSGSGSSGSSSGTSPLLQLNPAILLVAPTTPTSVKATSSCAGGRTDLVTWHSVSDADGYIIYSNGAQVDKITAAQAGSGGISTWSTSLGFVQSPITYGVQAYNSWGSSGTATAKAPGCP